MKVYEVIEVGDREEQQDRILTLRSSKRVLTLVADGAGGMGGGELASQAIVDAVRESWEGATSGPIGEMRPFLENLLIRAHERVAGLERSNRVRPHSTVVMLLVEGGRAGWIHSGDSRLYLFRSGDMISRTEDHSVLQLLLEKGKITESEMGTHPDQGKLLSSLGGDTKPQWDYAETLLEGDETFFLCSDGLWERVSPDEISDAVKATTQECYEKLVETAIERSDGDSDNVSIIAVSDIQDVAKASTVSEVPQRTSRSKLAGNGGPDLSTWFKWILAAALLLLAIVLAAEILMKVDWTGFEFWKEPQSSEIEQIIEDGPDLTLGQPESTIEPEFEAEPNTEQPDAMRQAEESVPSHDSPLSE